MLLGDRFAFACQPADQPGEIADVIGILGRALPGDLLVFPQHGVQLQLLEVMLQQDLWRLVRRHAHDDAPVISAT